MALLLDQLVYTSFSEVGFKLLTNARVSSEIQQAFLQKVVYQYWDAYDPPDVGYCAAYILQVSSEKSLFGWLYNDEPDEFGRNHIPYFVCYCLTVPLDQSYLETIFACLHKGPASLIDRRKLPAVLECIVAPDLWSYQPVRNGIAIPFNMRDRSYLSLHQGELINLFVPVTPEYKLRQIATDASPATTELAITPENKSELERFLAQEIGPMSTFLLQQQLHQAQTLGELIDNLAQELPPQRQSIFLAQVEYLRHDPPARSSVEKLPQPPLSAKTLLNSAFISQCQKELALYIGPIARFVLEETLTQHPEISSQRLVETLATQIPNPQQANTFRQRFQR